jgi:hypothetical protein
MRAQIREQKRQLKWYEEQEKQWRAGTHAVEAPPDGSGTNPVDDAQAYIEAVKRDQANHALANVANTAAAVASASSGFSTDLGSQIAQTRNQAELQELMRSQGLLAPER